MNKFGSWSVATTLVILALPLIASPTFAQSKKFTLEQAWAICKADVDRHVAKDNYSAR